MLINCRECNSEISSTAQACPKCGALTRTAELNKGNSAAIIFEIAGVILLGYSGYWANQCGFFSGTLDSMCMVIAIEDYHIRKAFWLGAIALGFGIFIGNFVEKELDKTK